MRTCLVSFRTHLITFTAAIALIASAAASAASPGSSSGGSGSSSGASTGAGSGGSAGGASSGVGGGSGHGGGGGGGGGHYYGGGGYGSRSGYGSDIGHGVYAARGGYRVVGDESAGVGRAGATPRAEYGARDPLALGPPRGSAAAATPVMDRFQPHPRGPHHPRPGHHPVEVFNRCGQNATRCANEMPAPLCILESNPVEQASPDYYYWQYGCTTAVKVRVKLNAEPIKATPID